MILVFLVILIILLLVVRYLFLNTVQIKTEHQIKMSQLQATIVSLHQKQKDLNQKIQLSNNLDATIKNDFKTLGTEIVSLQEIFLHIISEKK